MDDDDLVNFLRARLDEDEAAATAAAHAGERRFGGRPRWSASGTLLVDADDADNWAVADLTLFVDDESACAHIARHDPARVLREVELGRVLLDQYGRLLRQRAAHEKALAEWKADVEHEERAGKWEGAGDPGTRSRALSREADYLAAMEPVLRLLIVARAAVWSDHPDYRAEWKP